MREASARASAGFFPGGGHGASFIVIWRLVANMQAMSWGQ